MMMEKKIFTLSSKKKEPCTSCLIPENDSCTQGRITRSISRKRREQALEKINLIFSKKDPITQKLIKKEFRVLRNGVLLSYDAHTLYAYIKSSGDLRDPICRVEYAQHELLRLDRITKRFFKISKNVEKLKDKFKFEQERCGLRDHFLEELTNLFVDSMEISKDTYDNFITYLTTDFIIIYTQVTENVKTICFYHEISNHKKFLRVELVSFFRNQGFIDIRVLKHLYMFIQYI